jgi:hypothetical protein
VAKRACFLFEGCVRRWADSKRKDLPHRLRLYPVLNLSSNKRPGYDQILSSCESLIQLRSNEIIRDLYRGRTGTILFCDGFGQSDASEEFLLSTRQVSSTLSAVLGTHKRRCSQKLVEANPHAYGVAGGFEDDDLGVA